MREISGKIATDLTLDEDVRLHGMVNGAVTVPEGFTLIVHGMINGNLTIERGAYVEVRGMVNGIVRNSGQLDVWGMVNGTLIRLPDGVVMLHPNAVINGPDITAEA